jgi:copper chaperone
MCKDCGCSAGKNSQIKLYVKGYSNSDVKDIERRLLGLPGVYHVHIHSSDGQTTIDYNPELTLLSEITGVLTNHGLQAVI